MKTLKFQKFKFTILGSNLSRKSGQKCCRYGLNGKGLPKETIEQFINDISKQTNPNQIINKTINWQANSDFSKLFRFYYFKSVHKLLDYISEIYKLDDSLNLHVFPQIEITKDLFKIELYTNDLKGLSFNDLQYAFAYNTLNNEKYLLFPISTNEYYRREIRSIERELENRDIEEDLKNSQFQQNTDKFNKIKNKY